MNPIRVLVVDDSALMRKLVSEMIAAAPDMEVVGRAKDGVEALDMMEKLKPDVLTLDVEMPNMNGLETLTEMRKRNSIPVVMLSSVTQAGAQITLDCLSRGAFDFVSKPSGAISLDVQRVSEDLIHKVRLAATSGAKHSAKPQPLMVSPAIRPAKKRIDGLVVIGCSTGGPRALISLIPALPADLPVPVIVVQHMPAHFTASLALRLDQLSSLTVKEASEGDQLVAGQVLVAPGGRHLELAANRTVHFTDGAPVHAVKPAVDVTLASCLTAFGQKMIAVLLTGMGRDGASGLQAVLRSGGATIVEDESTCVVFGMPRSAIELNAAGSVVPLPHMASAIVEAAHKLEASARGLDPKQDLHQPRVSSVGGLK